MAKSIQHNVAYVACGSGCASAGGDARCSEGCIGCGACVTACPHGAIALVDGIARVDRSKCTGCGLCGMACPQRVIAFVPGYQNILVRCNNTDKGAIARKICDTSCIGCGMCAKKVPCQRYPHRGQLRPYRRRGLPVVRHVRRRLPAWRHPRPHRHRRRRVEGNHHGTGIHFYR